MRASQLLFVPLCYLTKAMLMAVLTIDCASAVITPSAVPNDLFNAPVDNPVSKDLPETKVTDPTYPLFGRRFPVVSRTSSPPSPSHVLVSYRQDMLWRIPVVTTSLIPSLPAARTKLTPQAVRDSSPSLAYSYCGASVRLLCPYRDTRPAANRPINSRPLMETEKDPVDPRVKGDRP
jgi:hypothetical protein